MQSSIDSTEIMALARILDELDYYELLQVERGAEASAIKRAYHTCSRNFHPDANRHLEGEVGEAARRIAMRVSEAYAILRDPRRRHTYDQRLSDGKSARVQLGEARAEAGRRDSAERMGRTAQGRQFYKLAEAALAKKDWSAAANNLQTALTFEPDNVSFREQLAEVRAKLR